MTAVFGIMILVLITLFFVFVFVILFGAPYLPTMAEQRKNALDLLDLKKGETMLELGSGDGTMLLEAAERGWKAIGYELNPILVLLSKWRARRYRGQIRVVWGNFWKADFSTTDGIFIFQMDRSMLRLDAKIQRERKGTLKIASHAFKLPEKEPVAKVGAVYLYVYS